MPQNELSHVNCIIVLGDEGKFWDHVHYLNPYSALSPDDESIKDDDLYFDQSNERIIEGASSPDMSATNSSSDSVTNGLWGIRIKIEALDVIPEEFRYLEDKISWSEISIVLYSGRFRFCIFHITLTYRPYSYSKNLRHLTPFILLFEKMGTRDIVQVQNKLK